MRVKARLTRDQVVSILSIPFAEYVAVEEGEKEPDEAFITDMINLWGCDRSQLVPKKAEVKEFKLFENVDIGDKEEA